MQAGENPGSNQPIFIDDRASDFFYMFQKWTNDKSGKDLTVISREPHTLFHRFRSNLISLEAAGGLVENPEKEILMIFRLGKWDLPKGKPDNGETPEVTAVREVQEECGIGGLSVLSELPQTMHVYMDERGRWMLKTTTWFHMLAAGGQEPVPQVKEQIEKAIWCSREEVKSLLDYSYRSVAFLLRHFLA